MPCRIWRTPEFAGPETWREELSRARRQRRFTQIARTSCSHSLDSCETSLAAALALGQQQWRSAFSSPSSARPAPAGTTEANVQTLWRICGLGGPTAVPKESWQKAFCPRPLGTDRALNQPPSVAFTLLASDRARVGSSGGPAVSGPCGKGEHIGRLAPRRRRPRHVCSAGRRDAMVGLGLGTLGALAAAQPANAAYSCVGCSAKEKARLESERREVSSPSSSVPSDPRAIGVVPPPLLRSMPSNICIANRTSKGRLPVGPCRSL